MKYCRYCAFCFEGDVYYCSVKNKVLKNITNHIDCDEYVQSTLGDVITGKPYKQRAKKETMEGQMNLFEIMEMFEG